MNPDAPSAATSCCRTPCRSPAPRGSRCRRCRWASTRHAQITCCSTTAWSGDLGALRLPEPRPPVRTDGLWRHTCFEAFIGHAGVRRLLGIQLLAVGRLGGLSLQRLSRRHGAAAEGRGTPTISATCSDGALVLAVHARPCPGWRSLRPVGTASRPGGRHRRRARVLSYWALKHPAGETRFPPCRRLCRRARLGSERVRRDPVRNRSPVRRHQAAARARRAARRAARASGLDDRGLRAFARRAARACAASTSPRLSARSTACAATSRTT